MNLDSLSFTLSQISYLVANLSKKNYKSSTQEISQLVALHGLEADRHLLRCLFSHLDLSVEGIKNLSKDNLQVQLLIQECAALLTKPALISNLCYAIDNPLHQQKTLKPSNQLLPYISKALRLSPVQEVTFGLALLHSSNSDTVVCATHFLKQKLPELIRTYTNSDTANTSLPEGGLHDTTPEVLNLILKSLFGPGETLGVTPETKEVFLKNLRRDFPRELVPVVLAPLLYSYSSDLPMDKLNQDSSNMANTMLDTTLADLVMEIGYGFTNSVDECRNHLVTMGAGSMTAGAVARVLSMMVRSHTGLNNAFWAGTTDPAPPKDKPPEPPQPSGWNVEVFVQTLKDMVPSLQWNDVILELDISEFIVKDRQGLSLLFTTLRLGLQGQGWSPDRFPVDLLYRHWKHADSQLSLFQQILKNPDIFCFADYPYHAVVIDILKTLPESDNKEILTWRSLDLVQTLLYLSERGLYSQVQELLKFPIANCPDVLVLALIQINQPPVSMVRQELLTNLIPYFLTNHPNSAAILHHAWHHGNSIKNIIMHAMAEWYLRGENDQTRLTRILEVAQDLKALSLLLNAQSFPFVIDLACLASRREYLKLEKWLSDKIREHGEPFVTAAVKFLQRRCPSIMGGIMKEENLPKSAQLLPDTLATILHCLQNCVASGTISQELSETIIAMATNCSLLMNKPRHPPGVMRGHRGMEPAFTPFPTPPLSTDPLANLSNSLAGMAMGGPPSSSAFGLQGGLGPLVSTPGSPSRLMPPSQSPAPPFPMMPLGGPVGSQVGGPGPSLVGVSTMARIGQPATSAVTSSAIDKSRIAETSNLFPEMSANVSKEIEDEANSYFQRIYNHPPHPTLSIDEVLEMLKKFQDSPNKREREVFSCMLRNLFEEYKFFPQYPDKELHITAQLFGGIIERGLVTNFVALGLALRFVLEALRKPHGSKMYYFGIAALDRFKSRLREYQKYCEHVSSIAHFQDFPSHLIEYVEYGLQGQEPPNRPQGPVLPATLAAMLTAVTTAYKTITATTVTSTNTITTAKVATTSVVHASRPSIANATNIDTLLVATEKDEKIISPPEAMQDKVAFIFNNLSQLNLQTKCDELREIVTEEYWPWISQYLVMKRASIELNFHVLYSNFLDTLKIPDVNVMVLKETYRNIRVLLRSDKGIANFSDRSLLKNLGHWLGMLTLGRNKPILYKDLDLISLLIEAYNKGQQELLYVVPFVAKVLESCSKSKVFKPPNPWTMSIMNVLSELHQEPDLKLNLKFEIEVLCKNLTLDVADLKPGSKLKDPQSIKTIEHQLSPPKPKTDTPSTPALTNPPQTPQQVIMEDLSAMAAVSSTPAPVSTPTPTLAPTNPPEPRFSYVALNTANITSINPLITINSQLALFQAHPHLKAMVRPAIERAIAEWINPVVERSVKIAITTSDQVVRKDFSLDPDESRMRAAAHHMVRNLTAGMAMITCRDQLLLSINSNLKTVFLNNMVQATQQQKDMVEQAATVTAQDNMELACAFIQKTAIEKATPEIDKQLITEFERRKHARAEGRRYCDSAVLTYQAERMPEQIRLKVGAVTQQQMAVYEEFARNIPGFQPLSERDAAIFIPKPVPEPISVVSTFQNAPAQMQLYNTNDEFSVVYEKIAAELELLLQQILTSNQAGVLVGPNNNNSVTNIHSLIDYLMLARRTRDPLPTATLLNKVVESLLDQGSLPSEPELALRYREILLRLLKCLQDPRLYGAKWVNAQITRYLTECREEYRYNLEGVDLLIRSQLVNIQQYDQQLSILMENGMNYIAMAFAMQLVQHYLVDDRNNSHVNDSDLLNTIETLARIVSVSRQPPEGLANLLDMLRVNHDQNMLADRSSVGPTAHIHSGILQVRARDYDDPPGLMEKTDFLLREWVTIYNNTSNSKDPSKAFSMFVHQMNCHGILKTDDYITRFFRLSTQMVVELCYQNIPQSGQTAVRNKIFHTIDAYVKLIALLVKHSGDTSNTSTKINLLNKVLGIVAGVLLQDHESHHLEFQQLPYHRIFIMLFLELNAPEPILEAINLQVLTAFCHTLHILRPAKAPGFAYAWLELVSHRVFLGRLLVVTPQQKGWSMYAQLLIDLFKYLAPFLRNAELAKPVTLLYKGTLRVLLVLLHDFPEFLCDYHYGFCDVIPPNCIQMRNLILSAFPRNMRLPDPFTPNLKVDMLQEISHAPRVFTVYSSTIQPASFKKDLDSYLKLRAPVTFLSELRSNLQVSNEPGMRYNISLMNALVLHVGVQAITHIRSKGLTPNMTTIAHSSHMDIFQNLAVDLDTEGRYLFLNAIANQLRYPNSHTHYFSCTLLYLFAEANTEAIQEQITRVLLERLIVNRPHPWGLLITFIELIKNPSYKFWNHEFVHCAPEIEKLFESVARSCMVQKHVQVPAENELSELQNLNNQTAFSVA